MSNEDVDMELGNKRRYTFYSDDEKTRFFHLFFSKNLSASAAARQLGIHIRAAQRWVKRYYEDPESIFEKKKKSGRHRILREEHKRFLLNYIDENPSAVLTEVVESLTQNFVDLNVSRSAVYNFMTAQCNLSIKQAQFHPLERNSEEKIQQRYDWVQKWQQNDLDFTTNCVFLYESAFHTNLKRSMAWSRKGTPAIVTMPTTKANATSILGAISATGLINVSLRVPKRDNSYTTFQSARNYIYRTHGKEVERRTKSDQGNAVHVYNKTNIEKYNRARIKIFVKFACISCTNVMNTKSELASHVDSIHIVNKPSVQQLPTDGH